MNRPVDRVLLLVLDSCGCGAAPDAARYGDQGANTLGNLSRAVGGLRLPHLGRLGLGHLTAIAGVPPDPAPIGAHGRMREQSPGKDTTTGHWELAGLVLDRAFPTFPDGFPAEFIDRFVSAVGRGVLGNVAASGTEIIERLGREHLQTGKFIVYTSADSVFQVAAHEEVIPLPELYAACQVARRLCDEYGVGRVIARPFVGQPGAFRRTYHRRDFSLPPPRPTVLDRIQEAGLPVVGVGKIEDIFAGRGLTASLHTEGNDDGMRRALQALVELRQGLVFCNLVDFDMLYGHRRDVAGYARALEAFDAFLPHILRELTPRDLVLLTADHGNDPTWSGTDHTREDVPLLAFSARPPVQADLGVRVGFYDVAQTLCEAFALPAWERGISILPQVLAN
ncbi:MAG: phosphopentomutase [Myxococcales bacterium]|nr:phosphopentomutase [Myxococcota bacterium]MDW8282650.1 phosphopentomutase [Myxococcales bacterium]